MAGASGIGGIGANLHQIKDLAALAAAPAS